MQLKTYKELYALVEQEISKLTYTQQPAELYEPIGYMLSLGGKRLRPVLVLMAADMFGVDVKKAIPAALAVEMFHNFSLVHDDIMDKADIRRGKPTVHKKWNETIAILSGDLMMIKATDLLCESETNQLGVLIKQFNATATEVCEGQQWDMNFESLANVSEEEYLNMITLKTAVLLGCSLKLGAIIANASSADAEHIYEFGKNIGVAFQIQDDILDSFGDGDKVGKKIGGDILANKKTILLIDALQQAKGNALESLNYWLNNNNPEQSDEKIEAILAVYKACDVQQRAEAIKERYLQLAFKHLSQLSIDSNHTLQLKQTAIDLMERMS